MSIPVVTTIEPDGTLRYDCGQDIAIRVKLHQRNGTKRCPVELLYQNMAVLATDSNLRDLRDIESLFKHATTRQGGVDWHAVLTAVAKELPEKAQAPWTPVSVPLSAYSVERKEYLWYPGIPKGEPTSTAFRKFVTSYFRLSSTAMVTMRRAYLCRMPINLAWTYETLY
jgi:hypothetical protein